MDKIKWYDDPYDLAEESQQTGIVFSFVSADNKQCHPWVKCRDFLQDAVCSTLTKKPCNIYGFVFDPSNEANAPVQMDKTLLLVSQQGLLNIQPEKMSNHKDKLVEFESKMVAALKLINHYEEILGEAPSKVTKHKDESKWYWLFEGPSFWIKSPALVSMYSFLIRLGDKEIEFKTDQDLQEQYKELVDSDTSNDKDVSYLKVCRNKLHIVIEKAKEVLLDGGDIDKDYFDKEITTRTMHNKGGIRSLCSDPCEYMNTDKATLMFKEEVQ